MSALPDLEPQHAAAALVAARGRDPEWLDAFAEALDAQRSGVQLHRILRVWDLTLTEAGRAFGVTRQAVTKWLDAGVPAGRAREVADLAAATDLLAHHLKRDRIAAVVRRPAAALDDRSLLGVLEEDGSGAVLDAARRMFTFTEAHA